MCVCMGLSRLKVLNLVYLLSSLSTCCQFAVNLLSSKLSVKLRLRLLNHALLPGDLRCFWRFTVADVFVNVCLCGADATNKMTHSFVTLAKKCCTFVVHFH